MVSTMYYIKEVWLCYVVTVGIFHFDGKTPNLAALFQVRNNWNLANNYIVK